MTKIDNANYAVDSSETATIEITAIKVGEFVTLAMDGNAINPSSTAPKRFVFTAAAASGTLHFGKMSFTFPNGTPPDAKYEYAVSGSAGGSFKGLDVLVGETSPSRAVNLSVK